MSEGRETIWREASLPQRIAAAINSGRRRLPPSPAPSLAYGRHRGPAPSAARTAAVLALLYPIEGTWHLALTKRQMSLRVHAGQISLPGGASEQDESLQETALRETQEELGVPPSRIEVLASLPEVYLFNSQFRVTPWLGTIAERPEFVACEAEVAEIIELPLHLLRDKQAAGTLTIQRGKLSFSAPTINYQGHQIWGATRLMLADIAAYLPD